MTSSEAPQWSLGVAVGEDATTNGYHKAVFGVITLDSNYDGYTNLYMC